METLRGRSPDMVRKELCTGIIAHNLIRCTMAESASQYEVPVERISFKGSLDALRHTSQAMAMVRGRKKKLELWGELLATLARDQVRQRPGRSEPRAVKRCYNRYPRLTVGRRKFLRSSQTQHPQENQSFKGKISCLRAIPPLLIIA